jgi:hypothetical protein
MDDKDRTITVEMSGKKFNLLLTVGTMRAILRRFGSLDGMANEFADTNADPDADPDVDPVKAFDAAVFLLVELINGAIERCNALNGTSAPLVTEQDVCALASPADFVGYTEKIMAAVNAGMHRSVESEDAPKNAGAAP